MRIYPCGKSRHWPFFGALRAAGLPFEASWLDWPPNRSEQEPTAQQWAVHSETCIREAAAADVLLLYAESEERQFGALVEAGATLASGGQVFLVGPHPWPFLRNHPRVRSFDTLEAAIRAIKAAEAGERARASVMRDLIYA